MVIGAGILEPKNGAQIYAVHVPNTILQMPFAVVWHSTQQRLLQSEGHSTDTALTST